MTHWPNVESRKFDSISESFFSIFLQPPLIPDKLLRNLHSISKLIFGFPKISHDACEACAFLSLTVFAIILVCFGRILNVRQAGLSIFLQREKWRRLLLPCFHCSFKLSSRWPVGGHLRRRAGDDSTVTACHADIMVAGAEKVCRCIWHCQIEHFWSRNHFWPAKDWKSRGLLSSRRRPAPPWRSILNSLRLWWR